MTEKHLFVSIVETQMLSTRRDVESASYKHRSIRNAETIFEASPTSGEME